MSALVTAGIASGAGSGWLLAARMMYQRLRTSEVPLCGLEEGAPHMVNGKVQRPFTSGVMSGHFTSCFKRAGNLHSSEGITNDGQAFAVALLLATLFPLVVLGIGLWRAVTSRPAETEDERKQRLKEVRLRNRELERENEKLRREAENELAGRGREA